MQKSQTHALSRPAGVQDIADSTTVGAQEHQHLAYVRFAQTSLRIARRSVRMSSLTAFAWVVV